MKMMRLLSLVLLTVIMVQTCGKLFIFVNYEFNKKQITEKYCVNKSKPMAHCEGMCHTIKQLQKEEKKGNAPVKSQNDKTELILFSQNEDELLDYIFQTGNYTYPIIQLMKITSPVSSIFHPPTSC